MPASIRNVAQRAGVAAGTVWRVVHDAPNVDPALRATVQLAMRELDYRPEIRRRKRRENPQLCFVLANREFLHTFHSRILQGVHEACEVTGAFVAYTGVRYRPDETLTGRFRARLLEMESISECLILAGTNYPNFTSLLSELGLRHVLLGNNYVGEGEMPAGDCVYWDDIAGAREAVRYLIELGHTDICYVGGPALPWITRPYLGYRQAMLEAGLEPHPELAALAGDAVENGRMIVELLLEKHRRFTAILADHETLTGACEALRGKRLETPRDVSVISLTAKGLASGPAACTALEVDAVQVGRALARMALERARVTRPVDNLSIPMDLVKRGSCRPISL